MPFSSCLAYIVKVTYSVDCQILQEKSQLLRDSMLFRDDSGTTIEGTCLNKRKPALNEQLAFLSVKHSVYLTELFEAIVSARKNGEADCEALKIEYRGSVADEAIILITKERQVIAQFRVKEILLERKDPDFENWLSVDQTRTQITTREAATGNIRWIDDLRHGMKRVSVEAEIVEITKPTLVHTQYGNNVMLTNAAIADHTGKIKLCLWNEQADNIKLGDSVQITDGSVTSFKGQKQLRLGRKGTINVMETNIANVKREYSEPAKSILFN
jgi:replication factor A1